MYTCLPSPFIVYDLGGEVFLIIVKVQDRERPTAGVQGTQT